MIVPPHSRGRSAGSCRDTATRRRRPDAAGDSFAKIVMKNDSPASTRLPAAEAACRTAPPLPCTDRACVVISDAVLHVHHRAGLGDDGLAGVERHDDGLQVVADELVVDLVRGHG